MKKLPDSEFEIMKVVWAHDPPITTEIIMENLGNEKKWKKQTAFTLLNRLVERKFLNTEKQGKERLYFPLVNKEDYLKFETEKFMEQFHDNSFTSLVATLYGGQKLSNTDIAELEKLL